MLVGCSTSQQHASVSQGRICSDNFACCHTEIEVADQTFYLTQAQYTDTGPTSPSVDPITPGDWQVSNWSANFWYDSTPKKVRRKRASNPGSSALEADALTTRPRRRKEEEVSTTRFGPVWIGILPHSKWCPVLLSQSFRHGGDGWSQCTLSSQYHVSAT